MTPLNLLHLNLRTASMMMDASTVMTLRLLAMGGALPARNGETKRMLDEKLPAFVKSATAAHKAIMEGERPDLVMHAALKPISRKVRANKKRLTGSEAPPAKS